MAGSRFEKGYKEVLYSLGSAWGGRNYSGYNDEKLIYHYCT